MKAAEIANGPTVYYLLEIGANSLQVDIKGR